MQNYGCILRCVDTIEDAVYLTMRKASPMVIVQTPPTVIYLDLLTALYVFACVAGVRVVKRVSWKAPGLRDSKRAS